jgi:spermidine synthase
MKAAGVLARLCFFVSGATGLVYQVLWVRMLTLGLGHSAVAVALVVATFMAGLGLGARWGGSRAHRVGRPLLAYGLLEMAIGAFAWLSPALLRLGARLASGAPEEGPLHLLATLSVSALCLIPATFAMGATLPMLAAWLRPEADRVGRDLGGLYAINTAGAVLGAGGAGFVLLPTLGQPQTLLLAASLNVCVGVLAAILGRARAEATPPIHGAVPRSPASVAQGRILPAFAITGFASLLLQVAWTRTFELFTGSSTYAFSLIVCVFIAGLAGGGVIASRWVDRGRDRAATLALLALGVATVTAPTIPVLGELPLLLIEPLARRADSFRETQLFLAWVLGGLLLLPTLLMGATWPAAVRALVLDPAETPAAVGAASAWNTGGAVFGALLAGLVAIPLMGLRLTLWLGVGLYLLAGALLLAPRRPLLWALPGLALVGVFLGPWDPRHLNLAPHLYARDLLADPHRLRSLRDEGEVRFHREGVGATVTVIQRPEGARVLRINGKTDASTEEDRLSQGCLGVLPLLLAAQGERVFVLGLGSGMSLASVLDGRSRQVRVAELLPEVVDAAHAFGPLLGEPLLDPRVDLHIADGRQLLRDPGEGWDVITSQPTNLFVSGIATLFTIESFLEMRGALRPGGVAAVWIQGYLLREADFQTLVRTFQEAFPQASLWSAGPFDFLLVGAVGEGGQPAALDPDPTALEARIRGYGTRSREWTGLHEAADLQRHHLLGPVALRRYAGAGPVQHDADPFLEFTAPLALFQERDRLDVDALLARREPFLPARTGEDRRARWIARSEAQKGVDAAVLHGGVDSLNAAMAVDPRSPELRSRRARVLYQAALAMAKRGALDEALDRVVEMRLLEPEVLAGAELEAAVLAAQGKADAAVAILRDASARTPWNPYARRALLNELRRQGRANDSLPEGPGAVGPPSARGP